MRGRVSENVALEKTASQISTQLSRADHALDGKLWTASCTKDATNVWWAVDLAQDYDVRLVIITSPDISGFRNYRRSCFLFAESAITLSACPLTDFCPKFSPGNSYPITTKLRQVIKAEVYMSNGSKSWSRSQRPCLAKKRPDPNPNPIHTDRGLR